MPYKDPIRGVYAITNRLTGARYIGVSDNILRRFSQHKPKLRQGISGHVPLQQAWNEYGESAFDFSILEVVNAPAPLEPAEQRWMDATPVLLNRAPIAGTPRGFHRTEEVLQMLRRPHNFSPSYEHRQIISTCHRGEKNAASKLTGGDVLEIRQMVAAGVPQRRIAAQFGVTQALISSIARRKIWAHI